MNIKNPLETVDAVRKCPSKIMGSWKIPAMMYGQVTVAMTKRQDGKLEVEELKMLRFSKFPHFVTNC